MTRLAVPAKARPALDAFIGRCLDPLPPAVLVDTHYNALLRLTRREVWRKAQIRVEYLRAASDFYAADSTFQSVVKCDKEKAGLVQAERWKAIDLLREGEAVLARTPAPDAAAVAWKRKLSVTYLPISAEELASAIADDEAFLAAHPVSRQLRGKKVQ